MIDLARAAPYVRMHHDAVLVLKIGGGSLERKTLQDRFARQLAVVHTLGSRVVVVHGAGPQTNAVQRALGEEPRLVDGRRVTTGVALAALARATRVVNEALVHALTEAGIGAVGLTAAGAGLVARRRPPLPTSQGIVDLGHVGDLGPQDAAVLAAHLAAGRVPVVGPPAGDGAGGTLNVNADLLAAAVATALGAAKLVLLTGAPGILQGPEGREPPISALALDELRRLTASGAIAGGMKVKAAAIEAALAGGVARVHVVSGSDPEALLRELYTNHGAGTLVTREPEQAPPLEPVAEVAGT